MKIGMKLGLSFAILVAFVILLIILGLRGMSSLNTEVENLVTDKFPKTVWAYDIIDAINSSQVQLEILC